MATETEHRFLLPAIPNLVGAIPTPIAQGYLSTDLNKVVRVRLMGEKAYLTIKGPKTNGAGDEFEYDIPVEDAVQILKICGPENTLSKLRYEWNSWEIDVFTNNHQGLVIAELEVADINTEFTKPDWLKNSVNITDDFRFANAALTKTTREELLSHIESVFKPAGIPFKLG